MSRRIGVLGGTFNPVHNGHLAVAEEVRGRMDLERVLFVPTFLPPHKDEDLPSALQRLEMLQLAIAGNRHFEVSDIEIKRGGRSYTIDTVEELRRCYPDADLFFVAGMDSFLEIRTWKDWERLLGMLTFVVVSRENHRFRELAARGLVGSLQELEELDRGGKDLLTVRSGGGSIVLLRLPHYAISSTDVRDRIRNGQSVKYLLPGQVERYIIEKNLYVRYP